MERVLHSGPWTFDNQLLMLKRWSKGMTSKNIRIEHVGADLGCSSRHGFAFSC